MKNEAGQEGLRWLTASEICIILLVTQKPISIIVLLIVQNTSTFLTPYLPNGLFSKHFPFSRYSFIFTDGFFLAEKQVIHPAIFLLYVLTFVPFSFSQ